MQNFDRPVVSLIIRIDRYLLHETNVIILNSRIDEDIYEYVSLNDSNTGVKLAPLSI